MTEAAESGDLPLGLNQTKIEGFDDPFLFGTESFLSKIAIPSTLDCISHLTFLEAVVALRSDVERWAISCGISCATAWNIFVNLASVRFFLWVDSSQDYTSNATDPKDVLVAWHAFMLNPEAYYHFKKHRPFMNGDKGFSWEILNSTKREKFEVDKDLHYDLLEFLENETAATQPLRDVILFPERYSSPEPDLPPHLLADFPTRHLLHAYISFAKTGFRYRYSSFEFDLPAAIHRQFSFAQKMREYGWLHTPFLEYTINRARARYVNFFTLISESPNSRIVPTEDIDLVWHTHQLNPQKYYDFCLLKIGKLFNHDDNITAAKIKPDLNLSERIWENRFGIPYSICLCWSCEATRAEGGTGLPRSSHTTTTIEKFAVELNWRTENHLIKRRAVDIPECDEFGNQQECHRLVPGGQSRCHYRNKTQLDTLGTSCFCQECGPSCDCGGHNAGCSNSYCTCTSSSACFGAACDSL